MKKCKLKTSLLSALSALLLVIPAPKTELKDIAKPHLGFYECEEATLSGKDLAGEFQYIRLELKEDGTFFLHYAKKDKRARMEKGTYVYDKEKQTVRLKGRGIEREFPLKEGIITVHISFGKKNLTMKFKQQ